MVSTVRNPRRVFTDGFVFPRNLRNGVVFANYSCRVPPEEPILNRTPIVTSVCTGGT